ncbi:uncharacterized protein LOC114730730 [Neltuma alba]|uniref:uncharacterized protein LOC114730730 n=1 Tax=Neltuma alba TaxID=207710 RepID=UPI0010A4C3C1|nr:uncharacterized protein LOC114730730 [Prosopis alba]
MSKKCRIRTSIDHQTQRAEQTHRHCFSTLQDKLATQGHQSTTEPNSTKKEMPNTDTRPPRLHLHHKSTALSPLSTAPLSPLSTASRRRCKGERPDAQTQLLSEMKDDGNGGRDLRCAICSSAKPGRRREWGNRYPAAHIQHFYEMANPNYNRYGFLMMISCVVLLIAPTGAGDDDGGKKLIIGLPYYKSGFAQFVDVQIDPTNNNNQVVQASGYSIAVFNATIAYLTRLHHGISFEFRAFVNNNGSSAGYYDALVSQISAEKYDAVVGDVTILENRFNHADFTLPYTQSNVKMLVKIRHDPRLNMWILYDRLIGVFGCLLLSSLFL